MSATPPDGLIARVLHHVAALWPDADEGLAERLVSAIGITHPDAPPEAAPLWDHGDVVLITYGDSILDSSQPPLAALNTFSQGSFGDVGVVHILPFAPSSSDRGFAVIDHRAVDPALGTWDDIDRLAESRSLMFDLVLNHVSSQSAWAQQFRDGEIPGRDFIRTVKGTDDLSAVVRPRSLPLVTSVTTTDGERDVWTTFSDDQFDLDWDNPELACEMLQVIDVYLKHGARFLRLDAVAYVRKRSRTTCLHLPETHELVRLLHTLLRVRAPEVAIITETNVPDRENRSYFGDGDEAHMVYNFTLPPLLVDGILHGRADRLTRWLEDAPTTPPGTTLFNFVASHDGIGLRPAEGILSEREIETLVSTTHQRGGRHGTYDTPEGPRPYELNIALPDLFGGLDDPLMPARVLLAHDVMFSLAGVPAVYINSLLATSNDHAAVDQDHDRRSINRRSVSLAEISSLDGARLKIAEGLAHRVAARRHDPVCHPDAPQTVRRVGPVLIVGRTSVDGTTHKSFFHNLSAEPQDVEGVTLEPYQSLGV